jgi:hypothetical protein
MEFLQGLGVAGFLFFLIKGLLWLVAFALIYFGLIRKEKIDVIKEKMRFRRRR